MLYKWNLDKTSPTDDKKLNTFYHHFTKTGHDNEVSMGPFSKYSQNYINTVVILRSQPRKIKREEAAAMEDY